MQECKPGGVSNVKQAEMEGVRTGVASTLEKGVVPKKYVNASGLAAKALLNRSEQLGGEAGIVGRETPYRTPPTGHDSEEVRP